jgi:S1-C subfamily serine protease
LFCGDLKALTHCLTKKWYPLKTSNVILGIVLLVVGFFIGTAWKSNTETEHQVAAQTIVEEENADLAFSASEEEANNSLSSEEKSTILLFEKAAPSVVFITTLARQRNYFSTNITEVPRGTGSGFVWDKSGHIITNYHVIQTVAEKGDKATVTFSDRSTWDAELVGIAPEKDLAVLKISASAESLRPIPIGNSERLRVGQTTYAIGNPFGLDQTLTTGIVSALGREIESIGGVTIQDVIQTDAAINPGNSGGPLLNSAGQLIGVNTAIYSPSGAYAGIGFSIPVDAVKWVVPDLIQYGRINRPTLGIYPARQQLNVEGVLIMGVVENSGAAKAGLQGTLRDKYGKIVLGDIITSLDNNKIKNYSDLILALEKHKPGETVTITILREEKEIKVNVVLDRGV